MYPYIGMKCISNERRIVYKYMAQQMKLSWSPQLHTRTCDGHGSILRTFLDEVPAELPPPKENHWVEKRSELHKNGHKSHILLYEMPILYPGTLVCGAFQHICQELS